MKDELSDIAIMGEGGINDINDDNSSKGNDSGTDWLKYDRYNILLEFAYCHLDFQRAELECVLSMYGITIGKEDSCIEIPLPNHQSDHSKDYPRPFCWAQVV